MPKRRSGVKSPPVKVVDSFQIFSRVDVMQQISRRLEIQRREILNVVESILQETPETPEQIEMRLAGGQHNGEAQP